MKTLVCVYCEGSDTKFAVIEKDKDSIKVLRAATFDTLQTGVEPEEGLSDLSIEGEDLELEGVGKESLSAGLGNISVSSQSLISSSLQGINLSKSLFIPGLTEPSIHYHTYEGTKKDKSLKLTQEIISDIRESKNVAVDRENLGYIELSDKSILSVFLSGEVHCISLINSLARYHGKRNYKIPAVKSAEISLAYYVAKRKKFFPDDYSLIVYIGKEYSKLIFLHGRKLKHIGSTLDIGTINLHTYDVYFSKILLEMENGGISSLDNIIVCGEDDSENLILSFYGTFPEANVSRIEFDDLELSSLDKKTQENFSAFSVPVAIAVDYIDEVEEVHKGINLLPKYVKEEQKTFQFAWHGILMFLLLFAAALFITFNILENNQQLNELDDEIVEQTFLLRQNQELLDQINSVQNKINSFDQTQAILDSATAGTGVWTDIVLHVARFVSNNRNLWITRIGTQPDGTVIIEGFSLSKRVLTDFAYSFPDAELKSIFYESLREQNTYKFNILFNISKLPNSLNE